MNDPAHQVESLITAGEAASILGCGVDWLYIQAAADKLPSYFIGGRRKFRPSELEAFIQQHAHGRMATVTTLERRSG